MVWIIYDVYDGHNIWSILCLRLNEIIIPDHETLFLT